MDVNKLIESTFESHGKTMLIDSISADGKQYINALIKHCNEQNIAVPFAPAHRICREKFGFKGTVDTFRRNILSLIDSGKEL